MTLALIARADRGGVASQSWEIARHLRPDRIMVVKIDPPRGGAFDPSMYDSLSPEVRIAGHVPNHRDLRWLCECTEILTVEGCYNDQLLELAHSMGSRLSIHANPELFGRRARAAATARLIRVLAPTDWALDRLPYPQVLWMPVATDKIPRSIRTRPPRDFLHVSAPAMLDRNGTQLVHAMAREYRGPKIRVFCAGPDAPKRTEQTGRVRFEPLPDVEWYWERYEERFDALLMPRRYGGLSLVMQEAMAAGLPVICLDRHPEHAWAGTRLVPVSHEDDHHMKAGLVPVAHCTPKALARIVLDHVESDPVGQSLEALAYADTISWNHLYPQWQRAFS